MEWSAPAEFVSPIDSPLGRASRSVRGRALKIAASHHESEPVIHFAPGHLPAVDPIAGVLRTDRYPYLTIPPLRTAAHEVSPSRAIAGRYDAADAWDANPLGIQDQRNGIRVLEVDRARRVTHDRTAGQRSEADQSDRAKAE